MKNPLVFNNFRSTVLISWLLFICFGSLLNTPVYALGPFLKINVTPSNVSFNIVNAEKPEEYYSGNHKVTVVLDDSHGPHHDLHQPPPRPGLTWYLGIRSVEAYLTDAINPNNRISISQLRWSKDGQSFRQLSQEWVLVNSYNDQYEKPCKETITYRLYPESNQSLPAGLYTVRIEFDARWINLPWR